MKNKTIATWLTFLVGPLGLHRLYLFGTRDRIGWLLTLPTVLGVYGIFRARHFGLDDTWIWLLLPLLGLTIAGCALNAIVYGLMSPEKWNQHFNPALPEDASSGRTSWLTILAVIVSLFIGTTTLMASFAFGFQRYFEYQAEAVQQTTPSHSIKKAED